MKLSFFNIRVANSPNLQHIAHALRAYRNRACGYIAPCLHGISPFAKAIHESPSVFSSCFITICGTSRRRPLQFVSLPHRRSRFHIRPPLYIVFHHNLRVIEVSNPFRGERDQREHTAKRCLKTPSLTQNKSVAAATLLFYLLFIIKNETAICSQANAIYFAFRKMRYYLTAFGSDMTSLRSVAEINSRREFISPSTFSFSQAFRRDIFRYTMPRTVRPARVCRCRRSFRLRLRPLGRGL